MPDASRLAPLSTGTTTPTSATTAKVSKVADEHPRYIWLYRAARFRRYLAVSDRKGLPDSGKEIKTRRH